MTRTCGHCQGKFFPADWKLHLRVLAENLRAGGASLYETATILMVTKDFLRDLGVR